MLYSNPHVPDQMLRVLIPKGCVPGATFNVSVPRPDTRQNKSTVNKFSREAQELLTEYSETYDSWCQVEGKYMMLAFYLVLFIIGGGVLRLAPSLCMLSK